MNDQNIDIEKTNEMLMPMSAVERIKWASDKFGQGVVSTTSGGMTSRIIPSLIQTAIGRSVPTIFVDTGYYSKETYLFVDAMEKAGIDVRYYNPRMSIKRMEALYGNIHEEEGDLFEQFLEISKHEPLNSAFKHINASLWVRGIMGFQTSERSKAKIFEFKNGLYRLHPILDWTRVQAEEYLKAEGLPINCDHFDITKGLSGKQECKIGQKGGFVNGGGI